MLLRITYLLFFFTMLLSCGVSADKYIQSYQNECRNNVFVVTENDANLGYRITLYPPVIQSLQQIQSNSISSKKESKEIIRSNKNNLLVRLEIKKKQADGKEFYTTNSDYSFDERILFYSTAFKKEINVTLNEQPIQLVGYSFERNYNLNEWTSIFFELENIENLSNGLTISFNNLPYRDQVSITIPKSNIKFNQKIKF